MWQLFFQLRSSDSYEDMWKEFLIKCGTEALPTVYQHVTDTLFNDMVVQHFPVTPPVESSSQPETTLDYNEKNALRYVGGYVTRMLHQKLQNSKHPMKNELSLCLSEMNDSDDWMDTIDQGGLKRITNMVYMVFVSVELVLRKHTKTDQLAMFDYSEGESCFR